MRAVNDERQFTFDLLSTNQLNVASLCQEVEDEGEDGEVTFPQYEINDVRRIWCRVLCVNKVPGEDFSKSLLGPTGHLERGNAWTHLIGAAIFLVWFLARSLAYGASRASTSNSLLSFDVLCVSITFFISTTYHVYSPNRFWGAVARLGDYAGIYLSLSSAYLVDLAISTMNLRDVPWQATVDVWIGGAIMVAFFVVRRMMLSIEETRKPYFANKCSFGFARSTNVDLEHSSLRAAGGVALAFSFILSFAGAIDKLEYANSLIFISSHITGVAILVAGMAIDNVFLFPDSWKQSEEKPNSCVCYSSREGCGGGWILNSHAIWHLVSLLSIVITSAGLEFVVASSDVLLG